jgi:hypothetical protein
VVRVKIKISPLKTGASLEVNSLLNTGFGTEAPEILVPLRLAEMLNFYPELPNGAIVKTYETPGGMTKMYYAPDAVEIQAITEDKASEPVKCALVISELEREVLLSDTAISGLEIVIESPGRGLWRFKDEAKVRDSVEPQYW